MLSSPEQPHKQAEWSFLSRGLSLYLFFQAFVLPTKKQTTLGDWVHPGATQLINSKAWSQIRRVPAGLRAPLAGSSSWAGCQRLAGLSSQIRERFGQTNKTELRRRRISRKAEWFLGLNLPTNKALYTKKEHGSGLILPLECFLNHTEPPHMKPPRKHKFLLIVMLKTGQSDVVFLKGHESQTWWYTSVIQQSEGWGRRITSFRSAWGCLARLSLKSFWIACF